MQYTVTPAYAAEGNITFESKNPDILTVDTNGVVTATGEGEATVEIKSEADNQSATVTFNITTAPTQLKTTIVDDNLQWTADKYNTLKTAAEKKTETLYAWRNDAAISQISVLAIDSAAQDLTVTAGDFTGANGAKISKENVKLTFIKSVDAYTGMPGYGSTTRPIPTGSRQEANEILYQDASTPIDVAYDKLQNVWVSIEVPENTAAGTYTGEISVTAQGVSTPQKLTYTLEVADAVLPDEEEFEDGFDIELWQNPYASAEYYGVTAFSDEHFAILRPIMEKYKSIGGYAITTTIVEEAWAGQTYSANDVKYPSMVKWTKKADGTWSFDYTDFDKWVKFNKELGIGDKIICYSIAPWSCAVTYYNEATKQNEKITVEAANGWNANWESAWRAFLQDLIQHVTDEGWKDYTYIGIDERGFSANAFNLIDSVLDIKGVPLKTAGAMDGFVDKRDLAMRLDVLSVGSIAVKAHPAEFEALRQERDELGLKTTVYTCTGHKPGSFSLSAPGESYWTMMYAYSVGGSGYMRWAYDSWVANPLEDTTHNAFEAGDCFLIFPDEKEDKANAEVRSSTRLEKMAQGVRDVNKLLMMQEEVSAMEAEVDTLMASIKATYPSSQYYLTEEGKSTLATDMNTVEAQIKTLTNTYLAKKAAGTDTVGSVTITEGTATTVALRGTKQLNVTVAPENLLNQRVIWSSENENIVSVSSTGVVTGHRIGSTNIKATSVQDSTKSATIRVTVERPSLESGIQVSYYSFDGDSNNTVKDGWGQRNGINAGGEYVDGKSGKGLKVNGTTKATFPTADNLTEQWTVGYWMYITETPSGRSSVMMSTDTYYSLNNQMHNSAKPGVNVGSGSGSFLTLNGTIPLNTWVNMTWTNDRTNGLRLYIDGTKTAENPWTKTATNNFPAPVEVVGGTGFNGIVDEVKIYNRALTETEVAVSMLINGLNIAETNVEMHPGETHTIEVDLLSDQEDQTITFTSSDPAIAEVDSNGVVTAIKRGKVTITVANEAGGYTKEVTINITKELGFASNLQQYELPDKYLSDVEKDQGGPRQYLAHPDMIMLDDNQTLITAYAIGHGKGEVVMQISRDAGETWEEKTNKPTSWLNSYETPTLYKLDFLDGSQKLIMISGRPNWHGNTKGGWDTSISNDGGETWSEYVTYHPTFDNGSQNWTIVAMASMIRMKDDNGDYIDKWMAIYHGYDYYNYKTYLTFDENGNEQWSKPELYLDEYREIEGKYGICEVGLFRSPDGERIIGLARSDKKSPTTHKSLMFYSDDEGDTWSEPVELPASLYGERHKMVYDPISGRLVVTFREIVADKNGDGVHGGSSDWYAGEWVAWVGTYEDIMEQNEGQYRILVDRDYAQNTYSGDTGYTGIVVQPDGTIIMDTYGHFDEAFSKAWKGGVTSDLCWIEQAKFKLGDIDYALGLVDRTALQTKYNELQSVQATNYTEDSYAAFSEALVAAKAGLDDTSMQQIQLDDLQEELEKAYSALESTQEQPNPDQPDSVDPTLEAARKALETLIDTVSTYKEADYQAAAFKNLTDKLNAAKTAYGKADATVAELEAAKTALEAAKKQADANKVNAELEAARKALKTLMDTVSAYQEADYQAAAFKNLTDKLNAAKTAYGKADVTVAELEAAKTALEAAKKQADANKVNAELEAARK
ncbi:MAG: Ig-like domain-containing protein, partial [Lachnospiraceae bacterium]|nr:Ig-like domain-containing protein [Lachnospiraceae bacterium]